MRSHFLPPEKGIHGAKEHLRIQSPLRYTHVSPISSRTDTFRPAASVVKTGKGFSMQLTSLRRVASVACLLILGGLFLSVQAAVNPENLKCEYLAAPRGIDILNPRLSWQLATRENGELQTAYRILVATSEQLLSSNLGDVWDTRKVGSGESVNVYYKGVILKSGQKYFWKVKVWGRDGTESDWSAPSFWTMGFVNESEWKAKWIGLDRLVGTDDTTEFTRLSARYLRTEFQVAREVQSATVYICGLGLYELSVNGKKIGNEVLAPAQTQFNKKVLYNTYDVTQQLRSGTNAIGVVLGNGRYFATRRSNAVNFGFPKLLFQMDILFRDGSNQIVTSDGTWKITADGPITANNEYDGETYDARKEMKNWNEAGFDDRSWFNAEVLARPSEHVRAQINEPIRVTQIVKPISVKEIRKGVYIYDLGQNMVGWVSLRAKGDRGAKIQMRFAESLSGDSLYMANLRGAKVTDEYVCKGDGVEDWHPRFTYHGFRYVELTGYPGTPDLTSIEGQVVHDDVARIGTFSSSNETVNHIFRNAVWGIRGNYRSFPTDCPQRDERQGWLGDRAMGSRGESFVFDIVNLYSKWMGDIVDEQRNDGSISDVCPAYWTLYSDNVTWDGTPIVLLDMLRTQYADLEIVRQAYPAMKKWHDYMTRRYLKSGLMPRDTYGDWCVPPDEPEAIHTGDPSRITPGAYIGSAYFFYLTRTMGHFAHLLGKKGDEQYYARQASLMKSAFNHTYFDKKTRTYSNNTATASILALAFDLVEKSNRKKVADNLVEVIETRFGGHIPTGLVGAQFLMRTLNDIGRADIALRFATQTDYPSWGYMIRNNATTIWELWNGNTADPAMNSQNHVMLLGDLLTWFFEDLAGIKSSESEPGFKHILMEPILVAGLDSVNASHESPYGLITSRWNTAGGTLRWEISVPVNVTATVHIPAGAPGEVLENGRPISQAGECRIVGMKKGTLVVELPSGSYRFSSTGFTLIAQPKQVAVPRVENKNLSDDKPVPIKLSCATEGATIRYTTDNTTPTEKSRIYEGTLVVAKSSTVRAKAFKNGYLSSFERKADVEIHRKRIPVSDITYLTKYSTKYPPADGDRALIDQQEGSMTYNDKKWVGYEGNDMDVILDLGKPMEIHQVSMRFLSNPNSWIFLPEAIEVGTSNTGDQFTPGANVKYGKPKDVSTIRKYSIPLGKVAARYVKIKVINTGKCPEWHNAAGNDAWIFVDEIYVE
jgi:alpha-L-rhamnosidase